MAWPIAGAGKIARPRRLELMFFGYRHMHLRWALSGCCGKTTRSAGSRYLANIPVMALHFCRRKRRLLQSNRKSHSSPFRTAL
ncbi:hypothetical protein AJ88_21605 [Mesorhizobium amorphae CCBAU 01583]|nr:hypothetical protein AJ88_21605 [Mesorhizobium amorphae CCBAU 01583]